MSVRTRLLNGSGFRHGPLNRRIDRIEAWSRVLLVLAFVVVTVPATWSVADLVARTGVQQEEVQQRARHEVVARLLAFVPDPDAGSLTIRTFAAAEWSEPDGSTHRAVVRVAPDHKIGSTQRIWTDGAGRPMPPPQDRSDTVTAVVGAVFLVFLLLSGLAAGLGGLLHTRFDARRGREWDAEWERVGPDWSHRQ